MDPSRGVGREVLDTALAVALRGIDLPHFAAVHDVDGMAPGLYHLCRGAGICEQARWPARRARAGAPGGAARRRLRAARCDRARNAAVGQERHETEGS